MRLTINIIKIFIIMKIKITESQYTKLNEDIDVEPSKTTVKNICDSEKFCQAQGKITFGQLKAIVESATRRRIFKHVGEGGIKATIRLLPWFVPQLFIAGAVAGVARAINKILAPSLIETENYKTFWGKAILKSFKIAEGDINLSDPLSKIFFISDGLMTMLDDRYKVKFAKHIAELASEKPDDEEVPEYFVENELRRWVNDKFLLNPPLSSRINEQEEPVDTTPDFNKLVYLPEEKAMIGAYMVTGDNGKMIEVLNIKEVLDNSGLFMDGAESYNIYIFFSKLPKSQIEMLGPVEGKEGFEFIKIPYWLYKKNVEGLSIRRSLVKKRLSISRSQVYGDYLKQINDPNVEKYFFTVDKDDSSRQRFKSYQRHYKPV
jgi:hypothetical protein